MTIGINEKGVAIGWEGSLVKDASNMVGSLMSLHCTEHSTMSDCGHGHHAYLNASKGECCLLSVAPSSNNRLDLEPG